MNISDIPKMEGLVSRLIKTVDKSFQYEPQDINQLFFWGQYFSLLELGKESLTLLVEERYQIVPIACRNITELYLDIYNSLNHQGYIDRLMLTSLKKQKKMSEFVLKNFQSYEKIREKERNNAKYANEKIEELESKGVKVIYGLTEKYEISDLTQFPAMYWMIDKMNQEVHSDLRLMMDRYGDDQRIPRDLNKGYISPYRNNLSESSVLNYVGIIVAGLHQSTKVILSEKKLTYSNSIKSINEQLLDYVENDSLNDSKIED